MTMGTLEELEARVAALEKKVNALPAGGIAEAVQEGVTAAWLEEMRAVVDGQSRRRGEPDTAGKGGAAA